MNTPHGFISVPFKAEKHSGLSSVNGIAKFSPAGIVLEFESKLFGLVSNGVKEVRIPASEILDIKFKKGLFKRGSKIEFRTRRFVMLAELPHENGKVTLKLERGDFERGERAVADLQKEMSEMEAGLPPPRTPVSELFDDSEDETRTLEK
jgi:hypothetical protein